MSRLIKIAIVCIILLFILVIVVWGFLPTYLSSQLTEKAGVPVRIESLQLMPRTVRIHNIDVGNPPSSVLDKALSIQDSTLRASITNYLSSDIRINAVDLDDVYIGIELEKEGSTQGNWSYIMNNLSKTTEEPSDDATKSVAIKELTLRNVRIDLAYRDTGNVRTLKPIDAITLQDIGSKGGDISGQIMQIVLEQALRNIFSREGLEHLIQDILTPEKDSGFFKDLFGDAA